MVFTHFFADADSSQENRVFNNLIYNLGPNSSDENGYRNYQSDGWFVYFNTISLVNNNATIGEASGLTHVNPTKNLRFLNNLIYIFKSGSGRKYAFNFGTNSPGIICDHNLVYIDHSTTITFGHYIAKRGGVQYQEFIGLAKFES